ncbi:MAG: citrate lyase synthetase, partial [Bacillariaceae sp.]
EYPVNLIKYSSLYLFEFCLIDRLNQNSSIVQKIQQMMKFISTSLLFGQMLVCLLICSSIQVANGEIRAFNLLLEPAVRSFRSSLFVFGREREKLYSCEL